MKLRAFIGSLLALAALGAEAQTTKFPFRLNWTLYGEHAPFFVARDKGFYREEGLDIGVISKPLCRLPSVLSRFCMYCVIVNTYPDVLSNSGSMLIVAFCTSVTL